METVDRTSGRVGILFVHANNVDVGGADYCMFKIVKNLKPDHFRPVVVLRLRTKVVDLYERIGVKVIVVPLVRFQKSLNILKLAKDLVKFPPSVWRLVSIIKSERVSIVHSNDMLDFLGSAAAKLTGKYAIQHVRMIITKPKFLNSIVSRILLSLNHRIICISNSVRNNLTIPAKEHSRVTVIYDPIEFDLSDIRPYRSFREKEGLASDVMLVGVVGRLEWWKGQEVLVRAADRILRLHAKTRFLIVGGATHRKERYASHLAKLVEDLHLSEKVTLVGEVENMHELYKELDIVVHTSILPEPLGNVIGEAMLIGRPVVAARSGGVVEQVDDGVSGLLYEPGNDRDLADKVVSLLKNPQLRTEMGLNGQRIITTKFNKEKILAQLLSIYEFGAAA
jgi:glycosyltransferase involved in cell wall biosynthesis